MKQIRIFCYGGVDFSPYLKFLPGIADNYEIINDNYNPQIAFYRQEYLHILPKRFDCTHVILCKEYQIPDMTQCNYAFQYDYTDDPCRFRFPYYSWFNFENDLVKPQNYDPEQVLRSKTKFCAFVYSRPHPYRNHFFDILSQYKHVDAPGFQRNNMPPIGDATTLRDARYIPANLLFEKLRNFLKDYKFVIAFENRIANGYVTEKICNPMLVNSIPIYLGNPLIERDFNTKSFVHVLDFFEDRNSIQNTVQVHNKEFNEATKYIMELDNNDQMYCDMLAQPWYNNNIVNEYADKNNIATFFMKIFDSL